MRISERRQQLVLNLQKIERNLQEVGEESATLQDMKPPCHLMHAAADFHRGRVFAWNCACAFPENVKLHVPTIMSQEYDVTDRCRPAY
jgi:hypothetical protein